MATVPRGRSEEWRRIGLALCEELGLDPNKVTDLDIALEPHGLTTAKWKGTAVLEPGQLRRALAAAEKPDDPDD